MYVITYGRFIIIAKPDRDRLHTAFPWWFSFFACFLRTLLHNKPFIKKIEEDIKIDVKKYKKETERVHDNASAFMHHLYIKINS